MLLAFGLRVFRLDAQSLWWDEVFSVAVGRIPFPDWIETVIQDRVHPPGFYALFTVWTGLGTGEFLVRFLGVLWGTASVALTWVAGRRIGGRQVAFMAGLLAAASPFAIWYSQEARMYAPLGCVAVASTYVVLRLIDRPLRRDLLALALLDAFGLYLQYLFGLLLLGQLVFLTFKRRLYPRAAAYWLAANTIAGLLFLPWLLIVLATGGFARASISWIPPAQWYDPILSLYSLLIGATSDPSVPLNWLGLAGLVGLALFAIGSSSRQTSSAPWLLVACLAVSIGFLFLVSLPLPVPQKRSIYVDRFLAPVQHTLLLLIALGLGSFLRQGRRWSVIAGAIIAVPLALSLGNLYFERAYARDDWRGAAAFVRTNSDSTRDLLLLHATMILPYAYYDSARLPRINVPSPLPEDLEVWLDGELGHAPGTRVWVFSETMSPNIHRFLPSRADQLEQGNRDRLREYVEGKGELQQQVLFQGILVSLYHLEK